MALLKDKPSNSKNGSKVAAKKGTQFLYNKLASYQSAQNRWVPYTIIGLLIVNLLAQCSTKNDIQSVQRHEKYAFLQKADGTTERIEQVNSLERSTSVIKKFAYDWTKTCFTWTGVVDAKADTGVDEGSRKYPKKFFNCGVAISPDFRRTYMRGLYDLYENNPEFKDRLSMKSFVGNNTHTDQREVQIYVEPLEPVKVAPGIWDIPVVGTREFRKGGQPFAVEKFNQTLELKAIPPYLPPWSKDQTPFGELVDGWQLQGLQIVKITRL